MFLTIRQRFYAIASLLLLSFALAYATLAFCLQKQSAAAVRGERAVAIDRAFGGVVQSYWQARFWERPMLAHSHPEADQRFGLLLAGAHQKVAEMDLHPFEDMLGPGRQQVGQLLNEYETAINRLVQLRAEQRINLTVFDSTGRALASSVMATSDPALMRMLFNVDRFREAYLLQHRETQYQALRVVLQSMQSRSSVSPDTAEQLSAFVAKYQALLDKDFASQNQIDVIDRQCDTISQSVMASLASVGRAANDLADAEVRSAEHLRAVLLRWFLVSLAVGITGLLVILLILARKIVRPVREMSAVVGSVQAGNIDARLAAAGRDELARLGQAFNQMLDTIGENNRRLVAYQRELEDKMRQLAAAESKSRSVIEGARDALVRIAASGQVDFLNPVCASMTGYSMEELAHLTLKDLIHPGDWSALAPTLDVTVSADAQAQGVQEFRARRKDGTWIPLELSLSPIRGDAEQQSMIGILRDITERRRAEQDKEELNKRLMDISRRAGMAEVATSVLHNVGNVLHSVNVSASLAQERIHKSKLTNLLRATAMIEEHRADLGSYVTADEKGRQLPGYLIMLAQHLQTEQSDILKELQALTTNIDHIKQVVATQQSVAKVTAVAEKTSLADLVEHALRMNMVSLERHTVRVEREFEPVPEMLVDKHKVLQILVNLISNAKHAMDECRGADRCLRIRIRRTPESPDRAQIQVIDSGVGIPAENLTRIFSFGFTTRAKGHGFGLHGSALAAAEMGGSLVASSEGAGRGAAFTLELPMDQQEVKA